MSVENTSRQNGIGGRLFVLDKWSRDSRVTTGSHSQGILRHHAHPLSFLPIFGVFTVSLIIHLS